MLEETVGGALRLLMVDGLVKGGGGQSGTGVGGLLASFEDEGGVSFVMVYFGCPRDLTGVDGSGLRLMSDWCVTPKVRCDILGSTVGTPAMCREESHLRQYQYDEKTSGYVRKTNGRRMADLSACWGWMGR